MKKISIPRTTIRTKRKAALASLLAGGLVLFATSWALALTVPPTMTVTIGGRTATLLDTRTGPVRTGPEWTYNAVEDRFTLARPVTASVANLGSILITEAYAIPDPVLFFSASASNQTANPLAYSVAFSTPLAPTLQGLVDSHAELGVTLTDGTNNGATVQPTASGGKMLTSFDLYASGTPISKNVNIGDLFQILVPEPDTKTTSFSADNSLVCGQACVTMSALLSFTLTGNDSVGFSGKVVQTPVPLPAAVWLFGSGLAGVVAFARRRMSV
ncbi:MAG: hypothetical protein HOP32_05215 [Nitrospira sp.]|nr:hypothetical protein [Nitrospira sp.]